MHSLQAILDDCELQVTHIDRVHGGDINECYCLYTSHQKYFLKVNKAITYPGMLVQEALGLKALKTNCDLFIPEIIKHGSVQQQQYLLLQWIDEGQSATDFWETFGTGLALLHQKPRPYFGWTDDNYIGSLPQINTNHNSWHLFYAECRIIPLAKQLFDAGNFNHNDLLAAEMFCKKIEQLFPQEPAALLHGDLWSGNFLITANGNPAIFDPAIYYGHREMDIGMTKLFGGFDQRFYDAYNNVYPLENNWKQRLSLTQLYPLLLHALLFGGHYIQSARTIIKSW